MRLKVVVEVPNGKKISWFLRHCLGAGRRWYRSSPSRRGQGSRSSTISLKVGRLLRLPNDWFRLGPDASLHLSPQGL